MTSMNFYGDGQQLHFDDAACFQPYAQDAFSWQQRLAHNARFGPYGSNQAHGPSRGNLASRYGGSNVVDQLPQVFSANVYTHNPYAESCSLLASAQSPPEKFTSRHMTFAPYTAPTAFQGQGEGQYTEAVTHPVIFSLEEQFACIIGSIANTARTTCGRTLLQSVLRLQHVDKTQMIFNEILSEIVDLSLDTNATNVVRQLMEYIDEAQLALVVRTLNVESICTLATHSQLSRRVLQTMFEHHKTTTLEPVVQVLASEAHRIAVTQQGCITVMRILENATQNQQQVLITALTPSLANLAVNPYGNYVVQAILTAFPREQGSRVIEQALSGHWVKLSRNKFGSNVMEKVVQLATNELRAALVEELVMTPNNLHTLIHDSFGNFVLQALIDNSSQSEFQRISSRIRVLLPTCPYGHKIDARLRAKKFPMRNDE